MEKTWTVYMHTNKINNKVYVGITSQDVKQRWRNGKGYLKKRSDGSYVQTKFARAIQKYGWDNFEHIVWAEGLSHKDACNVEQLLIAIWDTIKNGYNITAGGEGAVGVINTGENNSFYGKHHTEETKALLSEFRKKYYKENDHCRCEIVYQFDMNGNFIQEFKSLQEMERKTGISHSVVARVCNGKLNYTHGYTWAYKKNVNDLEKFKEDFLHRIAKKKRNNSKHLRKPVNLYDLAGNFIASFESASELARQFNVHADTVAWSCRNDGVFQGKFKCKYI